MAKAVNPPAGEAKSTPDLARQWNPTPLTTGGKPQPGHRSRDGVTGHRKLPQQKGWALRVAVALRRADTGSMATQPIGEPKDRLISIEEYLSSNYEPDCEYDDGVIVERNLGEFEHSFLQTLLATIFTTNMESWGVYGLTEQRIRIAPTKFRIPDVCVLRIGAAAEDILTKPPLIAIEILSPEDTIRRATRKAAEYNQFGIEHVWVVDPQARVVFRGTPAALVRIPSGELTVAGTPILIHVAELFEKLDRIRGGSQQ